MREIPFWKEGKRFLREIFKSLAIICHQPDRIECAFFLGHRCILERQIFLIWCKAFIEDSRQIVPDSWAPWQLGPPDSWAPGQLAPGPLGPGQLGPGQLGPWTVVPCDSWAQFLKLVYNSTFLILSWFLCHICPGPNLPRAPAFNTALELISPKL